MARRRKKDTEKTLEMVVGLLVGIPIVVTKALSGIGKTRIRNTVQVAPVDLQEVDQMDGLSFEHYVAELLKRNGYRQVIVTSGSGDFGVDITAYKDNTKYAFQCKNYQSKLGVSPIQEVYSGAPKYNASICVVVTNSYFTPHARELAKSLKVMLWDRTKLANLMCVNNDDVNSVSAEKCMFDNEDSEPKQSDQVLKFDKAQDIPQTTIQSTRQDLVSALHLVINRAQKNLNEHIVNDEKSINE